MRILATIGLAAALSACAMSGGGPELDPELGATPFQVERGTALPPPAAASATAAPPEGAGPNGLDFGPWRSADPAAYAPAFETQMRERFAGQDADEVRAALEADGFACESGGRLDCRIEIMEQQCAFDWYVVVEPGARQPIAGFDRMCLGARQG